MIVARVVVGFVLLRLSGGVVRWSVLQQPSLLSSSSFLLSWAWRVMGVCHWSRIVIGAGSSLEHDCRRRRHQMNIQYTIAYFVKERHRKRSSDWRGAMERVVGVVFIVIGSR